ncbi:alpha/beta hydrolase [Candidatus Bandiella euplotis]|uniref:Alpha/beta hydrolase family protein n=1 Tax=Candidatus Bandiella euplotis TaxID=1664265 RepID=A0ABZ0UNM1_9RICK|nr:alpha/beta hydrolase [Candidatus Bandiella woodruffii]WPX96693.1 Alpha/beta hydrolase family protein [Candidatus Bandiella woodruffii]
MIKEVIFNGEMGRLEGRYYQADDRTAPAALVLHPHPLHGGTMNNKVVYNTFYTFVENHFSVLRFNFRGVGKSLGTFDHGQGELIDAATALDWLQAKNPEASSYWIAGFSFGAWITMQLLMRRPEIDGFVVIAPSATSHDYNFISPCPKPGLIVQGTNDEISKEEDAYALYEKLAKQRNSQIEYVLIEGADHFFTKHKEKLIDVIDQFIKPRVIRTTSPKKIRRDRKRKVIET